MSGQVFHGLPDAPSGANAQKFVPFSFVAGSKAHPSINRNEQRRDSWIDAIPIVFENCRMKDKATIYVLQILTNTEPSLSLRQPSFEELDLTYNGNAYAIEIAIGLFDSVVIAQAARRWYTGFTIRSRWESVSKNKKDGKCGDAELADFRNWLVCFNQQQYEDHLTAQKSAQRSAMFHQQQQQYLLQQGEIERLWQPQLLSLPHPMLPGMCESSSGHIPSPSTVSNTTLSPSASVFQPQTVQQSGQRPEQSSSSTANATLCHSTNHGDQEYHPPRAIANYEFRTGSVVAEPSFSSPEGSPQNSTPPAVIRSNKPQDSMVFTSGFQALPRPADYEPFSRPVPPLLSRPLPSVRNPPSERPSPSFNRHTLKGVRSASTRPLKGIQSVNGPLLRGRITVRELRQESSDEDDLPRFWIDNDEAEALIGFGEDD